MVLVTACLGGFLYGFATNAIPSTVAQPTFIAKFLITSQALQLIDGILGGLLGGSMVGSILQAPVSNKFDRCIANAVAACIVIFAAAISAGAVNVSVFISGRFFTGFGAGMVLANSPAYMSEVAHPHNRVCALGFNFVEADIQWRLVFIVLCGDYLGTPAGPGVRALVALYFIMGAFFTSTIECTSYIYGSEIWPTHLRSECSTIAYLSFFGNAIACSASVSVGLNNIGWKFYMILICVTVVTTIMIVIWFLDTMGLTLEEI
ncbi:d036642a-eedf-4b84-9237-ee4df40b2c32 [Sclerotinia trifoliorum]|uniref:D036642a-eedf-4b84-9237-ee4df40b2c32 n=1 Tax=Sclerotinia trifoliorum TaxID=28548 RepID=A0A8H2VVR3_9HELO|nr:d036642a-eedf-4b84-9237-ee4df40b2c32 [Sclerotinia trifoliorum]